MKTLRKLLAVVRLAFRRAVFWLISLISLKDTVLGIRTIDMVAVDQTESRLPHIAAALHVLDRSAPIWLRRMRRHLRAVVVQDSPASGYTELGVCVLKTAHLDQWSSNAIAAVLAHETTHAIIDAAGYSYLPEKRARIERACVRAELRLAERLGDVQLTERIAGSLDRVWWEDAQLEEEREKWWREGNFPQWVLRFRRVLKGPRG